MEHLSTWKETEGGKVLTMGKDAIQQGDAAQLDPWCRILLWPDCTLSGGASARTSTAG